MTSWLCTFAVFQAWLCSAPAPITGYIEAESRYVSPIYSARIEQLHVQRGDNVNTGDLIATMEAEDTRQELAAATALLAEAEARLANLTTGKRDEEIAVLAAARDAARVELNQRILDLSRVKDLVERGMQNRAALDAAQSAHDVAEARLGETNASLKVAGIAARAREIDAARQIVVAREADVQRARWRYQQHEVRAPQAGRIEDVIRYSGEVAAPNAPIVVLLPPASHKLRLFVPEPQVSGIQLGQVLNFTCDGCTEAMTAEVDFIAREPEYTPPVLYSAEHRSKLVVLVEARLSNAAMKLLVGQLVDVDLPDTSQ